MSLRRRRPGLVYPVNEDWRYVGEVGEPAFQNSWVNIGGEPALAYRIREAGVVDIQGSVVTGATGTAVFELPVGYRPSTQTYLPLASQNGSALHLLVDDSGDVTPSFSTPGDVMHINVQVFLDPPAVA